MGILDKLFGDDNDPHRETNLVQCSLCDHAVDLDWMDAHYQVNHPVDDQPS